MVENNSSEKLSIQLAISRGEYLLKNIHQTNVDDEIYLIHSEHLAMQNGLSDKAMYLSHLHEKITTLHQQSMDCK